MNMPDKGQTPADKSKAARQRPFRRAVLRGLGVVLPPLLTIVLFIWAWTTIDAYVLRPTEAAARWVILNWQGIDVKNGIPADVLPEQARIAHNGDDTSVMQLLGQRPPQGQWVNRVRARGAVITSFVDDGRVYVHLNQDKWIPETVYAAVRANPGELNLETASPRDVYNRWVHVTKLQRHRVIPFFLFFFIALLYLLGKFLAAGAGRIFWNSVEALIHRLPIIRNVYSSVKQVTDFVFSEREIEYTRVVAVQYPRRGIWSMGFVTGESMLDIRSAANEPVLSVLIPTSPMPATGFTVTVLKSETVDLNLTVDQAIQFIVSCGVVVPTHQQQLLAGGTETESVPASATPLLGEAAGENGRNAGADRNASAQRSTGTNDE